MTTKIGLPLTTYELLNTAANLLDTTPEEEDEWITTSTATLVKPYLTLYMRTPGVEICIGLRPRKRALSPAPEPLSSPFPRSPLINTSSRWITEFMFSVQQIRLHLPSVFAPATASRMFFLPRFLEHFRHLLE